MNSISPPTASRRIEDGAFAAHTHLGGADFQLLMAFKYGDAAFLKAAAERLEKALAAARNALQEPKE
jgi:hypothetical protein